MPAFHTEYSFYGLCDVARRLRATYGDIRMEPWEDSWRVGFCIRYTSHTCFYFIRKHPGYERLHPFDQLHTAVNRPDLITPAEPDTRPTAWAALMRDDDDA